MSETGAQHIVLFLQESTSRHTINPLTPGRCRCDFKNVTLWGVISKWYFLLNCHQVNVIGPQQCSIYNSPGNSLVSSSYKPLTVLILIKFHDAIWYYQGLMSYAFSLWKHKHASYKRPFIYIMTTSSTGNIFCITGPLWGESKGHQ